MFRSTLMMGAGALMLGVAFPVAARQPRDDARLRADEFSSMTCDDFRSLSGEEQGEVLAWMDGYQNGKRAQGDLGQVELDRDPRALLDACERNPRAKLSKQIRSKDMPRGNKVVRPDRMSCSDFSRLDSEVQIQAVAFANGYQARNQSRASLRNRANGEADVSDVRRACSDDPRASFWEITTNAEAAALGDGRGRTDDAARMTCSEFSSLSRKGQSEAVAWMDGYSHREREAKDIGEIQVKRDTDELADVCKDDSRAQLRSALRSNMPRGEKSIVPGRMNCEDFDRLEPVEQQEVVAFANGYHARTESTASARSTAGDELNLAEVRRSCRRDPNGAFWEKTEPQSVSQLRR